MADLTVNTTFKDHEAYLEKRGIDRWTRDKLGIISCGPTKLKELGFKWPEQWNVQSALLIPANCIDGSVAGYGARLFYQKTFGEDSRAKYISQPTRHATVPPGLHFSPLSDWDKLEYGQRIFITESYVKANVLGGLGLHAVGVSGCWGWSHRGELNPALTKLDWRGAGLRPTVLMDSNVHPENPKLWNAAKRLQAALDSVCGIDADWVRLPAPPTGEGDWGLDDFALHHGGDVLLALATGEGAEPIPGELDAHLAQLNTEVCVIRDVGRFADINRNILMGRSQFEDVNYADRMAFNSEEKRVPVAKVWTRWDRRNVVDTLRYRPGEERLVTEGDGPSYFNLWRGWGCTPIEGGDATPFVSWVRDAFPNPVEREFFLDWWGFQLQHPGVKMNTATMLVGSSGVGKGWMANIAERIFGSDNTWKCNLSDLESRFNSGMGASQLLVIEEADVAGGVKVYNVLKDLITNEHLRYERKGVDAVKLDNCLNIFLNSNHINVLRLDEFDRRFAILEITCTFPYANDLEYWEPRWEWLRTDQGAEKVMGFLLSRPLSKGFNPHGEAPWTQAKRDMIESTHDPLDQWVVEHVLRGEPLYVRGALVSDAVGTLMNAKELAFCYYDGQVPIHEIDRKQSMAMVKALNSARAKVANAGKKINYQGVPGKYYWVGKEVKTSSYQRILDERQYFVNLVASLQGRVANDSDAGYPKGKF